VVGGNVPLAPLIGTIVCIAAVNVVLAAFLAGALFPGGAARLGAPILLALMVLALASGAYAAAGWRGYLRRRRG
jgi:hypothetical protein